MYTQALDPSRADDRDVEDAVREARFQARIDAEERIEPNDWMPEAYRRTLMRQISQHAHSEIVGMLPEGNWITRAPTLRRKAALLAKVQDECGHGALSLRRRRDAGRLARGTGRADARRQGQIFLDLQLPDADLGGYRRHRLAGRWRRDHEPDSALPLFLRSLCARDDPRLQGRELPSAPGLRDHGHALPRGYAGAEGDGAGRAGPLVVAVLMMFGPPDKDSQHSDKSMRWKIKRFSNDELRQKFVDATVPQGHYLGPDNSRPRLEAERQDRALGIRRDRLGRIQARARRRRAVQPRAHGGAAQGA